MLALTLNPGEDIHLIDQGTGETIAVVVFRRLDRYRAVIGVEAGAEILIMRGELLRKQRKEGGYQHGTDNNEAGDTAQV